MRPAWTTDLGSAIWAGPRWENGVVYAGGDDGHVQPGKSGAFGFPGSPAVGDGLLFVSGLDGQLYAFAE